MRDLVAAVEEVRRERVKGASWSMRRLAEAVIRDAEQGRLACSDVGRVTASIVNANKAMGSLWNLAEFIRLGCERGKTIDWGARLLLWYSTQCRELMAANLAEALDPGASVFTLSYSSAVELVISLNTELVSTVYVSMSEPGGEGVELAKSLRRAGVDTVLLYDSDMARGIRESDVMLIGADSVSLRGECVFNKLGSLQAAIVAKALGRQALAVFESYKIHPAIPCKDGVLEAREERISGWGSVFYSLFDPVPFSLLSAGLVETGIIHLNRSDLEKVYRSLVSMAED